MLLLGGGIGVNGVSDIEDGYFRLLLRYLEREGSMIARITK
jgi:hypothetical protein